MSLLCGLLEGFYSPVTCRLRSVIYGQVSIKDLSRKYLILEMKIYSDKELELEIVGGQIQISLWLKTCFLDYSTVLLEINRGKSNLASLILSYQDMLSRGISQFLSGNVRLLDHCGPRRSVNNSCNTKLPKSCVGFIWSRYTIEIKSNKQKKNKKRFIIDISLPTSIHFLLSLLVKGKLKQVA